MSWRTRLVLLALGVGLTGCSSAGHDAAPGEQVRADPQQQATTSPGPTSSPAPPCPRTSAIDDARWTTADGGRSLAVTPSAALRECAGVMVPVDDIPPGWRDVVDLAGAEADTPAMLQQYLCHLRFARTKDTWNLEPWRPEADEQTLLRTRCNP